MRLKMYFIEWTGTRVIAVLGLLVAITIIIFAWTNIGAGPTEEVKATVQSVGMDTGTSMSLPRYLARIQTHAGETALIEIPRTAQVVVGTKIIVGRTPRQFTNGHEYIFLRSSN